MTTKLKLRPSELDAYCDGAAMAYRHVAAKLRDMIARAPNELKPSLEYLTHFADACEAKAREVYKEADRFETATRHETHEP